MSDLSAFVVSSKDSKSILKADLESDEESDSLDGVVAAIDVVTHEEVVGVGRLTTNLKELSQVVELTVNVTADRDWSTDLLDVRLVNEDFLGLNTIQNLATVRLCLVQETQVDTLNQLSDGKAQFLVDLTTFLPSTCSR